VYSHGGIIIVLNPDIELADKTPGYPNTKNVYKSILAIIIRGEQPIFQAHDINAYAQGVLEILVVCI